MAALWESWGVVPGVVVGHSLGEIAAACVSGALSLDDAARVVCLRSQLLSRRAGGAGGMVIAALSGTEAEARLSDFGPQELGVGVYASPGQTVFSGSHQALDRLMAELDRDGIWARRIAVDYASHSPMMEELREPLTEVLDGVAPNPCKIPMFSTVRAARLSGESLGAAYWADNLCSSVRLAPAIAELAEEGVDTFIELSPHPVLAIPVMESAAEVGVQALVVESLRRNQDGRQAMRLAFGALHAHGVELDGTRVVGPPSPVIDLPTYPWQRRQYWVGSSPIRETAPRRAPATAPGQALEQWQGPATEDRDRWLHAHLRRGLNRLLGRGESEDLGADDDLFSLGIDSIMGLELAAELGRDFAIELEATTLFQAPTLGGLAALLTARLPDTENATGGPETGGPETGGPETGGPETGGPAPAVTQLISNRDSACRVWHRRSEAARLRLVCLPYAAGGAGLFADWPRQLPESVDILALRAPGRESRADEAPHQGMEALLDELMAALRPCWDEAPIALVGHSMGALVAFELAHRAREEGLSTPVALWASAMVAPQSFRGPRQDSLGEDAIVAFLRDGGAVPERAFEHPQLRALIVTRMQADAAVLRTYVHNRRAPLDCPVYAYAARQDATMPFVDVMGWGLHTTSDLILRSMPGGHFFNHTHPQSFWRTFKQDVAGVLGHLSQNKEDVHCERLSA